MRPGRDPQTVRRLILLTNEYPFARGDASFVQHEIDALRGTFDEVVIFNYPADGPADRVPLPDGVRYGGSLKETRTAAVLPRLLVPTVAARWLRSLWAEVRHRRVGRLIKPVLLNSLGAVARAEHPGLRSALRGADVSVYSFWAMGAGAAVACLPAVRGTVALRLHRYDLYEEVLGWLPLRGSLLTRPDVLLPISDDGARYLRERYPWRDLAPMTVSRLGTADHGIGPVPSGDGRMVVFSCSAITPVKRVGLIAQAVSELARRRPVRWVHFGDGPLRGDVEAVIAATDGGDLEVELRGQAANEKVIEYLRTHPVHVFVNASSSEGVPVSIMEAMSFDIPVVATDVGGVSEVVGAERGSGSLVPAEITPAALARVIEKTGVGSRGARRVWEARCDAQANSRRLVEVITR